MRVLVTGGAGFIGSALVRHLVLVRGWEVLNVDKLTYAGNLDALSAVEGRNNYRFLRADICDGAVLGAALEGFRPDIVMHVAAESHVDRSIAQPEAFVQSNIVGTYTVLDAVRYYFADLGTEAARRFRYLQISTDEVFGSLGSEGRFSENSPYNPRSPYAASKAAADHLVRAWWQTYGLPVMVSYCTNTYGPYQAHEKLIPRMVTRALSGLPLTVYGNGKQVRDWLHVDDHVAALVAIAERGTVGESYCIGADNEWRNIDLIRRICGILDGRRPGGRSCEALIAHVADRPGHDVRYGVDARKLKAQLGWRAEVAFSSGLEDTVAWYAERWEFCHGSSVRGQSPYADMELA